MKRYKIIRHPAVDRDLLDIIDLIADYAGKEVALRKLNEIESTIKHLSQTPHTGTLRPEIHPEIRAIPTARKGVVCFVIDDEAKTIKIVAIIYAGREWSQAAKDRTWVSKGRYSARLTRF